MTVDDNEPDGVPDGVPRCGAPQGDRGLPADRRPEDGGCWAFLRRMDEHAESWSSTQVLPAHAQSCAPCADRLRRLDPFLHFMRARPALPEGLKDRRFLDEVFEDVVEAAESEPLAEHLRKAMDAVPAPVDSPWPLQDTALEGLGQDMAAFASVPAAVEGQLWRRTLADVREIVAETGLRSRSQVAETASGTVGGTREAVSSCGPSSGQYSRRAQRAGRLFRLVAIAAGIALVAVGAWNFKQSDGTRDETRVVFVDVGELPNTLTVRLPNGLSLR